MWLTVSGFMVMELVSRLSLAKHLTCVHIWPDSGSSLVVHATISQDRFQYEDSRRLVGHIISSFLLLATPEFSPIAFSGSTTVFILTSCLRQLNSVAQSCPTLCDPMDCSKPGFSVHNQLLELAQIHVHQVGNVIQLSHPLSSPSPPAFTLAQHQGLF